MRVSFRIGIEAVRGTGGREGGQEEDTEVDLVGPHLHTKQNKSLETVQLGRHNSKLHSTVGPGTESQRDYLQVLNNRLIDFISHQLVLLVTCQNCSGATDFYLFLHFLQINESHMHCAVHILANTYVVVTDGCIFTGSRYRLQCTIMGFSFILLR